MLDDILVFGGLMALLGVVSKITLTLLARNRPTIDQPAVTRQLEEISQRLGRLDHAIDSTALEVERISEAQRFTTKLLANRAESVAGSSSDLH